MYQIYVKTETSSELQSLFNVILVTFRQLVEYNKKEF